MSHYASARLWRPRARPHLTPTGNGLQLPLQLRKRVEGLARRGAADTSCAASAQRHAILTLGPRVSLPGGASRPGAPPGVRSRTFPKVGAKCRHKNFAEARILA